MIASVMTDSVSLMASLIDSLMDSAASLINFFAIRYALTPADDEHRFGHGKAEALAGIGQAAFIVFSALFLMVHAVNRVLNPQPIHATNIGIAVMVFSLVATIALVWLQRYTVKRTGSTAIAADALHYLSDVLVNASIIAALLLSASGWINVDAYFGLFISIYIVWSAWEIAHSASQQLLDREIDDDKRDAIYQIIVACDGVRNVHDLRTRQSGHQWFVQVHVEVDRELPLWRAHDIAEAIETAITTKYPQTDVIVHQDPSLATSIQVSG
jgi:ferrous-iron efflux pump FieF